MTKLTTPKIKELIVAQASSGGSPDIKNWSRIIKKSFKDEAVTLRVFECWVGWNWFHAVVKTSYPADDTILSLEINLFDGTKYMPHKFYETL